MKKTKNKHIDDLKIALEVAKGQITLEECDVYFVFNCQGQVRKMHSLDCRRCITLKEIREALR